TDDEGRVTGAVGFPFNEDKLLVFKAKAVILATGAGGFKPAGFPISSLTSDGEAMAYRVGAEITGKEFVDLHETSAVTPANGFLYPEDVFSQMTSPRILAFLNLDSNLKAHNGEIPVASAMGPPPDNGSVKRPMGPPPGHGPGGRPMGPPPGGKGGIPPDRTVTRGPLGPMGGTPTQPPIRPDRSKGIVGAATSGLGVHKSEGIWPVDENYATSVPGLYAAGDCCGSMLGGAKYGEVGCSSAYSSVQGAITGKAAAEYALKTKITTISKGTIDQFKTSVFEARTREKGYSPEWVTQLLQNYMTPYYVLYIKKQDRLEAALTNIEFFQNNFIPKLYAQSPHELRLAHDIKNMLLNAEWKLKASLFRTESRGVHYREDYPARDDENWLAWVMIREINGEMELYKKPIPEEWRPDPSIPYEQRYPDRFPGELEYLKAHYHDC
ncbi:MAG: FAD-binding protein, partial [Deltaproteobacteria bacterium]|nr:FAD-binding protein [Deltaproteobacteria bacterium]